MQTDRSIWSGVSDGTSWNSYESRRDLHVINGGTLNDEILEPFVRPFAGPIGDNFILMQEKYAPNMAKVRLKYRNRDTCTLK